MNVLKRALIIIGALLAVSFLVFTVIQGLDVDLRDYFALEPGMVLEYAGEGNEYAPFVRTVVDRDGDYLQLHDNNGGTIMAQVLLVKSGQVAVMWQEGEAYDLASRIPEAKRQERPEEILLQRPLRVGNTWMSGRGRRTIKSVGGAMTVAAGSFPKVIQVQTEFPEGSSVLNEYYAPGVGLIRREYRGEWGLVWSELAEYR